jgi:hypothetical protein
MARPDEEEDPPDPEDPADPDVQKEYKAPNTPKLEHLSEMSDEELHKMLGHHKTLEEVRKGVEEAMKLTGAARTHAEDRVKEMFTPHIGGYEFKYLAEDAKRAARKKDGKSALDDDSPASVM